MVTTDEGDPVRKHLVYNVWWTRLRHEAKLPEGFRIHDLRHSAVTSLLTAGVPMAVVSRIAGHSTIRITVDQYGHTDLTAARAGIEAAAEARAGYPRNGRACCSSPCGLASGGFDRRS